jgi:hypothetical protein
LVNRRLFDLYQLLGLGLRDRWPLRRMSNVRQEQQAV